MELEFATWERIALIALVIGTSAWFVKDLVPKIRHIRAGRPEGHDRLDRLGSRIATVVKEVIFQYRVVNGRKVAGTLHALVFFGFVAFGLETLDHFLEPYGVPLLHALLGTGGTAVFKTVLAVMAVLVMIGIGGLFVRRFFFPQYSPDPKSYSSGVVAAMIFLLMATYLWGLDPSLPAQKGNWWVHALLIVAFPPLILRSKHFHILMAPVDIFLRTHRLGDLLPLDLSEEALMAEEDVSLGLEAVADTPWKMRMDFLTCVECKRCTDQCPAWNAGLELNPRGFILDGRAALGNDEAPVVGTVISEKALGQCTTCGACEAICPVGIEHLQLLIGAKRSQALATGKGMVATEYLESIERFGNPFSEPKSRRQKLIEELGIPTFRPGETEYLLWLGCVWNYNDGNTDSLRAMVEVLERAGVSYGVLEDESCSGHHSRRQGEEMQFQTLANENLDRFQEAKVTKMVTGCPHCFHTIQREYPTVREGFRVEMVHHSQLLADLIQSGKLTLNPAAAGLHLPASAEEPAQPASRSAGAGSPKPLPRPRRLTFHDPCYLGRYENVTDEPRQVIARAGFEITELERRRERTYCCGGGAAGFAIPTADEDHRVDVERKKEIKASGADILVTACPECKIMLDATVDETLDLVELVARSSRPDL